jgi:glycosyltransferase involved in cell wall biosynthesis
MSKIIVQIIDEFSGGGAQRSTLKIAKGFSDKNHKVHLISIYDMKPDYNIDFEHKYYTVGYDKKSLFKNFKYSKKLKKILAEIAFENGKIDLILGNLGLSHKLMSMIGLDEAYYTIRNTLSTSKLDVRSGLSRYIKKKKIKKFYDSKKLVSVSYGVRDDLIKEFNINPKENLVIYNPFDFDEIRELAKKEENFYKNEEYIVHVGRFVDAKRHDVLLKAYALADIDAKLLLLGQGENEDKIINLIKELNIEDKVILAGFYANPYPIIKDAKMMVLSSDFEGLPTVLIESLVLDTPVVSTDCKSGANEILTNKLESYLSPVGNEKLLSENIKRMYENPLKNFEEELKPFYVDNVIKSYLKLCKND